MYPLFGCVLICSILQTVQCFLKCNTGNQTFVNCTSGCCPVDNSTYEQCCPMQGANECNVGNQTFINCTYGCCPLDNSIYEQCCKQESTKDIVFLPWIKGTVLTVGLVLSGLLYYCQCRNQYRSGTQSASVGQYPNIDRQTLWSSVSSNTNTSERQVNKKKPTLTNPLTINEDINIPGQPLVSERVSDRKIEKLPQFSSSAFPGKGYKLKSGSLVEFHVKTSNSNSSKSNMARNISGSPVLPRKVYTLKDVQSGKNGNVTTLTATPTVYQTSGK